MRAQKVIVWFRNDLRLHDQEALYRAVHNSADIIPIYCFDPRHFEETYLGFPKTNSFRAQFLIESIQDLRQSFRNLGSDLLIRIGHPEDIIPSLAQQLGVSAVYYSQEITDEEIKIEEELEARLWAKKIFLEGFWTSTLYHIEDIPYPINNLPDIFTQFRKGVEKTIQVRKPFPSLEEHQINPLPQIEKGQIPTLSDLGLEHIRKEGAYTQGVLEFWGGEKAGLERLETYIWKKNLLQNYKETRNGLLGGDYSSKFSPWLALGTLSPRKVYEEVKTYESQVIKNQSTYWLIFELIWRDYFRFVARKYGNRIFQLTGIRRQLKLNLQDKPELFQKWINGETGIPFIDANMRELKYTGFMSNRGRQNVASFLAKDLSINWIWGAMYFESQLIDYDVCSNWGNWNYVVGVGNDPRENRYFNIISQAKRYDGRGNYVKHWLPELAKIPSSQVHHPIALSPSQQELCDLQMGVDYPHPIVDYKKWIE